MLSWGQEWLEEGSWTGLHRLVGCVIVEESDEDSVHGGTLRERFRGERTMACDWGGEDPCWHFSPLSGELKTLQTQCLFLIAFLCLHQGPPWAETEGSISSPFTINAARCRNGVACMDWSWARAGPPLAFFLSWWQCYMWLSSPCCTSAE